MNGNTELLAQDTDVQKQLEKYFADVDQGFSTYYERNSSVAEPQLDGHLANRLEKETLRVYIYILAILRVNAKDSSTFNSTIFQS